MRRKNRKVIAGLLAAAMMMGCVQIAVAEESGAAGASGNRISEEPITITAATYLEADPANSYLTKYIEEELGIKLEWQVYNAENFSTQLSLMLTTDTLPDVFFGSMEKKESINEYGADGYLLDMTQYLDVMPNMCSIMENYPNWEAYQKDENGAIYGIARLFPSEVGLATGLGCYVNTEWLDRVGMEVPTTTDELYEVLKAFKEQDANGNGDPGDEIPLGIQVEGGRGSRFEWMLLTAYGFPSNNQTRTFYVDDENQVHLAQSEDRYKDYLKYMRRLYEEGLMEPMAFTISDDERIEKTKNDVYGIFFDYAGLATAIGGMGEENPYEKYACIPALKSEYNDELVFTMGNCGYGEYSLTYINAETEYPEEICKLVDFFLSEEGTRIAEFGKEGETFEFTEDAYGNKVPGYINGYTQDTVRMDAAFKLIRTSDINTIVENSDDAVLEKMIFEDPDYTYAAQAATEKELRSVDRLQYPFPDLSYSGDDGNRYSVLRTDVDNVIKAYKSAFILGEKDIDSDWEKYQSDLEAAGLSEELELVTGAYATFLEKQK